MKSKHSYYAVWANNGLAAFDNWSRVLSSRHYLRGDNVKKYTTIQEAKMAAIANYNAAHEYAKFIGNTLETNKIEFTKNFS